MSRHRKPTYQVPSGGQFRPAGETTADYWDPLLESLSLLGMHPTRPMTRLRTGPGVTHRHVFRAEVASYAGDRSVGEIAVKAIVDPTAAEADAFAWEHRVPHTLHPVAEELVADGALPYNPIVWPTHSEPLRSPDRSRASGLLTSVTPFVETTGRFDAWQWGRTLGMLHRVGSTPEALTLLPSRSTNALAGFRAAHLVRALARPEHPFHGETDLALQVVRTLRERVGHAMSLDPEPLLVHRDLHPLNCVPGRDGLMVVDWAEAGWGNRSDDFAWVSTAVSRFGLPARVLHDARAGYESASPGHCPSLEQIAASGQVRELICLAYSLLHAGKSPAHLRECVAELPILTDPAAPTATWAPLFNPSLFHAATMPMPARRPASAPTPGRGVGA